MGVFLFKLNLSNFHLVTVVRFANFLLSLGRNRRYSSWQDTCSKISNSNGDHLLSNNMNNLSKAAYTKPTLIEYGSLAERTKMFGLAEPNPDIVTLVLTTVSIPI